MSFSFHKTTERGSCTAALPVQSPAGALVATNTAAQHNATRAGAERHDEPLRAERVSAERPVKVSLFIPTGLFVYVLACANNTYYVGKTFGFNKRIRQHVFGDGAVFTKKNKPLYVCCYWENCSKTKEFEVWYKFAKIWGADKVGGFTATSCLKLKLPFPV